MSQGVAGGLTAMFPRAAAANPVIHSFRSATAFSSAMELANGGICPVPRRAMRCRSTERFGSPGAISAGRTTERVVMRSGVECGHRGAIGGIGEIDLRITAAGFDVAGGSWRAGRNGPFDRDPY